MQISDTRKFAEIMAGLGEIYGKNISTSLLSLYRNSLENYDIEDISRAANLHVTNPDTGAFMPKPADFIKHLDGGNEAKAALAWSKAYNAISSIGSYEDVAFDDPLIHCVINDMGGWVSFCSMMINDAPFKERDFVKRYSGYLIKKPEVHPKFLCGRNLNNKGIALIGDRQKANKLLESQNSFAALVGSECKA